MCNPLTTMTMEDKQMTEEQKREAEKKAALARMHISTLNQCVERAWKKMQQEKEKSQDLSIKEVFDAHAKTLMWVANNVVLAHQRRKFVVDDNNRDVLRFLLYYFNGCPLAEDVFPGRGYKLHKHIMLQGAVGTGKTLLMQVFSEYLNITGNPRFFYNLSVTQMVNYYTLHNNLDRYTFNEEENKGFKCENMVSHKITADYSKDIIGLWEGVEMTGESTHGTADHRWEYMPGRLQTVQI